MDHRAAGETKVGPVVAYDRPQVDRAVGEVNGLERPARRELEGRRGSRCLLSDPDAGDDHKNRHERDRADPQEAAEIDS